MSVKSNTKYKTCSKCTITLCEDCNKQQEETEFESWLQSVSRVKIKAAPIVSEDGCKELWEKKLTRIVQ